MIACRKDPSPESFVLETTNVGTLSSSRTHRGDVAAVRANRWIRREGTRRGTDTVHTDTFRRPGQQIPHTDVRGSSGIGGNQVAGEAFKGGVAAVRADRGRRQ